MTLKQMTFGLVCAAIYVEINFTPERNLSRFFTIAIASLIASLCLPWAMIPAPATLTAPIDLLPLPLRSITGLHLFEKTMNR